MDNLDAKQFCAMRQRIEIRVWDGRSNVNDATPAYIRANHPWADQVYLLLIDGQVAYLQSHEPFVNGYVPLTKANVRRVASAHADWLARQMAAALGV